MNKKAITTGRTAVLAMAALALLFTMSVPSTPVDAKPFKSPFPKLKGSWKCLRGGCWVRPVGGAKERVNCRVNYVVGAGGRSISQKINCRGGIRMTSGARVRLTRGRRVAGSWSSYNNHTGRVRGGASGTARSNRVYLGVTSSKGYVGAMSADIKGRRHTVRLYRTKHGKRNMVGYLKLRR